MRLLVVSVGILALLAGWAFAGCASDAYSKTCASCPFDENGKVDQSCKSGYQSSGTTCVSTSYPIMSAQYAQGKCPAVDGCADELRSCTAQYSSGNDKEDCMEGSASVCYSAADQCVKRAAISCGEIEKPCPGSAATFILLFAGLAFVKLRS
ncbi:hypothetical protein L0Y65_04820 [Candidatus Micrarchaeota archaeon]|nr:hypothetical protein [Candidatus Micrarchaeota archaeon]